MRDWNVAFGGEVNLDDLTDPNSNASAALRAAYGRSPAGLFVPGGWGVNWKARLAAAGTSLVKVGVVGDSITAGYFTSNPRTKSWPALLAARLQAAYGDGGSGFTGAASTGVFATTKSINAAAISAYQTNGAYWATAGTWALYGTNLGPGAYAIRSQTAASTVTIPNLRGTTIKLFTLANAGANANWTYSIDGAAAVPVTDAGAGLNVTTTTITGLTAGTHTVTLTYSGDGVKYLYVLGAAAYNATGVAVDNYASFGAYSYTYAADSVAPSPGPWSGGSANGCDLYVYALGVNDCNNKSSTGVTITASAAPFSTNLTVSAAIAPGTYLIDSELVTISASTSTTATLLHPTAANHNSGATLYAPQVTPDAWARAAALNLADARSSTGATDLAIVLPHVGSYDLLAQYHALGARARGLAEEFGAALVNLWTAGRNSYGYMNGLGYWGTSATPGAAGADAVHLSDAGAAFYDSVLGPVLGQP